MQPLNRRNFLKVTLAAVIAAECAAEENLKAHLASGFRDGRLEVDLKLENCSDQPIDFMAEIGAGTAVQIQAWLGDTELASQSEQRKLRSRALIRNLWTAIPAKSTQMMKRTYFTLPPGSDSTAKLTLQVVLTTRSGSIVLKPSSLNAL
jgi:hypothetical protein